MSTYLSNEEKQTLASLIARCSVADLESVRHDYQCRQKMIQAVAGSQFRKHQKVWFTSSKTGERIEGIISRVNTKSITVDTTCKRTGKSMIWRVGPTLLKAA